MTKENNYLSTCIHWLEETQADNIVNLDVSKQTTVTDNMIICSGRSSRHVKAIAAQVEEEMKRVGFPALTVQGLEEGTWVLLDFADFVVHVMQPDIRDFYHLEGLWS